MALLPTKPRYYMYSQQVESSLSLPSQGAACLQIIHIPRQAAARFLPALAAFLRRRRVAPLPSNQVFPSTV